MDERSIPRNSIPFSAVSSSKRRRLFYTVGTQMDAVWSDSPQGDDSMDMRRNVTGGRKGESVFQPRIMRQKLIVSRVQCHLSPGVMDTPGLSWRV